MKSVFQILGVIGVILLLIVSLLITENPFEWIEGLSINSIGYPKFAINGALFCGIYLSIIYFIKYIVISKK